MPTIERQRRRDQRRDRSRLEGDPQFEQRERAVRDAQRELEHVDPELEDFHDTLEGLHLRDRVLETETRGRLAAQAEAQLQHVDRVDPDQDVIERPDGSFELDPAVLETERRRARAAARRARQGALAEHEAAEQERIASELAEDTGVDVDPGAIDVDPETGDVDMPTDLEAELVAADIPGVEAADLDPVDDGFQFERPEPTFATPGHAIAATRQDVETQLERIDTPAVDARTAGAAVAQARADFEPIDPDPMEVMTARDVDELVRADPRAADVIADVEQRRRAEEQIAERLDIDHAQVAVEETAPGQFEADLDPDTELMLMAREDPDIDEDEWEWDPELGAFVPVQQRIFEDEGRVDIAMRHLGMAAPAGVSLTGMREPEGIAELEEALAPEDPVVFQRESRPEQLLELAHARTHEEIDAFEEFAMQAPAVRRGPDGIPMIVEDEPLIPGATAEAMRWVEPAGIGLLAADVGRTAADEARFEADLRGVADPAERAELRDERRREQVEAIEAFTGEAATEITDAFAEDPGRTAARVFGAGVGIATPLVPRARSPRIETQWELPRTDLPGERPAGLRAEAVDARMRELDLDPARMSPDRPVRTERPDWSQLADPDAQVRAPETQPPLFERVEDVLTHGFEGADRAQARLIPRERPRDPIDPDVPRRLEQEVLADSPRDLMADETTARALEQRRMAEGTFEGQFDPVGRVTEHRRAAEDPFWRQETVMRPDTRAIPSEEILAGMIAGQATVDDALAAEFDADALTGPDVRVDARARPRERERLRQDERVREMLGFDTDIRTREPTDIRQRERFREREPLRPRPRTRRRTRRRRRARSPRFDADEVTIDPEPFDPDIEQAAFETGIATPDEVMAGWDADFGVQPTDAETADLLGMSGDPSSGVEGWGLDGQDTRADDAFGGGPDNWEDL